MVFLYNFGLLIYSLFIRLASLKNKKAQKWLAGRKKLFQEIERAVDSSEKSIWFHFASLGEFEQGRPVLEQLKKVAPVHKIVITFYSPSGYEIRKNYSLADHVFYLPLDTRKNAGRFIKLINPSIAVFTKYEYWYHHFKALSERNIPLFIVSAIFRENQIFFKWYGSLHRKTLSYVSHFFAQNEKSRDLLNKIGFDNVSISGDTRFDRVAQNASHPQDLPLIRSFCGTHKVFIGGSTWPEDEALLSRLAPKLPDWKFIIAPHEIHPDKLLATEKLFPGSTRYSQLSTSAEGKTLIIDNVGMLSSLYQHGAIAFIGGGFGAGIHNTLEAAAFGLPVIFGPKYSKFQEARDLISSGGGFTVKTYEELESCINSLLKDYQQSGEVAKNYVMSNTGATEIILKKILDKIP